MSIVKKSARVAGKVVTGPLKFVYKSYFLRYTSLGRPYSPGQSTKMTIEDSKRARDNLSNTLEEMEVNRRKIPKTATGLRRKYLRAMEQFEMTIESESILSVRLFRC